MGIINNKSLVRKIIIAIVIVMSFNFVAPTLSMAIGDEDSDTLGETGGVLLGPVIDLVAGICDCVMVILQVCMKGGEFSLSKWMVDGRNQVSRWWSRKLQTKKWVGRALYNESYDFGLKTSLQTPF